MANILKNIAIATVAITAIGVMCHLEAERVDDVYGHYVQATSAPADTTEDDTTEDEADTTDAYDCVWLDDECYIIEVVDYTEDEDGDKFIEYEFVDKTLYE